MEKLNAFKSKANEFAASQRGKMDSAKNKVPFSGKKDEDGPGPRHFATIATKDVSTFAPPPKRVGNIPGARLEDREKGPATTTTAPTERRESASSVMQSSTSAKGNVRPPPPLPSRSQTSGISESISPSPRETAVPAKISPKKVSPLAAKPVSPSLPPRRESATIPGPSHEVAAPSPPAKESSYGQFRKTFGTAVDSTQVNDLRNSLKKTTSFTSASTTGTTPKVNMSDVKTASGIAQKYRTDPNSISLADAKAGLNVANKILPPSQDKSPPNRQDLATATSLGQKWNKDPKSLGWSDVKAGYAVANKFRPAPTETTEPTSPVPQESTPTGKNGLSDLKSRFTNVSLGGMKPPPSTIKSPPPSTTDQPISPPPPKITTGKRAPPPPPPKPRLTNGSPLPSPTVPAIPLHTKPSLRPSSSTTSPQPWTPKDIPLNFEKNWYSSEPMQQIPYLAANPSDAISASSITASGSGSASHMTWLYTATFAIRWTKDLSRTFIRVTWSSDSPSRTVRGTQKHFPPPTPLGPADLERAARLYGAGVVAWCERQVGRQVGDGECWTLAHDALEFVGGTTMPRVMVSCGKVHGQCVYAREAGKVVMGTLEGVRGGDVVQYLECKFERRENGRVMYSSTAGAPDHTSVVTRVRGDGVMEILHQNVGGVRKVQKGELNCDEMVSGKVWIYRPVWEAWAGSLEPKWDNSW